MSHPLDIECPLCGAAPGQRCIGKSHRERKAFHRVRGSRRKRAHVIYADVGEKTESPIETILASAILEWIDHHAARADVSLQAAIGPFRADILVEEGGRRLVVECDGKAFHGSQEQVERDKRRDRYCACRGICVMRFSGAEINRDPRGCAAEVGLWIRL
jgi:very-short-patch-repair endonuclease